MSAKSEAADDPVVRELDVYLNPDLDLWLLQFPLRPSYLDQSEFVEIKDAKVKPKSGLMELGVNYGNGESKVVMDGTSVADAISLGIGKLQGDALHLTPIHNVQQIRPSLTHLTAEDGQGKSSVVNMDLSSGNYHLGGESDGENTGYTPAGRKNDAMQNSVKQNSYIHLKREQEKEPAIKLKTWAIDSKQSEDHFKALIHGDS